MLIYSTQLGDIEVSDDKIISFPYGLPGFPDEKNFAFLPYQVDSPFAYLQSVVEPQLTFLVVDPFAFFKDYEFEMNDHMAQEIELAASNLPRIVNIVSIPAKTEEMTTNLLAPLVINTQNNKAVQIILEKTAYTTRHRLFSAGMPQSPSEGEPL